MTVDPTDPDTFETPADGGTRPEVPEADAAEQQAELLPTDDDAGASGGASGDPIDPADAVNDADAAEQARIVEIDEDDYR